MDEYEELRAAVDHATAALRLIGPGRRRAEVDAVVHEVRARLREVGGRLGSMRRRDVLRSIGTVGMAALTPASAIRAALMSPTERKPVDHYLLARAVRSMWRARQACRYDELAALAPVVMSHMTGDDALASSAYQCLAASMAKLGAPDLAWVAAERAVTSAQRSGDPLLLGAARRRLAHVFLAHGNDAHASRVAIDAAQAIRPDTLAARSVYGALCSTAAIAAARRGQAADAYGLLKEAEAVATVDGNHYWLGFGPTNVELHMVAVAVDLDDPARAVAGRVPLERIPLVERRAQHLLDLAQGYRQRKDLDECVACLLQAEHIAAEEVRYQGRVKALVTDLLRDANDARVDALAVRVGVGVR